MYQGKERREMNEVQDRPVELWIKVIGLVAVVTLPLCGVIGTLALRTLDEINFNIAKMQDNISLLLVNGRATEVRLDNIEIKAIDNSKRIYALEGKLQ